MSANSNAQFNEFILIQRLQKKTQLARADVICSIGDDAALLKPINNQLLAVSMDTLIAGIHFPLDTPAHAIGWKSLAVNLSDLAAMGAKPQWTTLALTTPKADITWLNAFTKGWMKLAKQHQIALVGGDTTRGPLSITVQAHGSVPKGKALLRNQAQSEDIIFVSGTLGDARAGLAIVQKEIAAVDNRHHHFLIKRLNYPTPRVALGQALLGIANSCIDISDGFLQDLSHILKRSHVGAQINADKIPASPAFRKLLLPTGIHRKWQMNGGDDYELCFTVPQKKLHHLNKITTMLKIPLTAVGKITRSKTTHIYDINNNPLSFSSEGYQHF